MVVHGPKFREFYRDFKTPEQPARYVAAIEDPGRPQISAQWSGMDTLDVTGPVLPRHVVALQVRHDDGCTPRRTVAKSPS